MNFSVAQDGPGREYFLATLTENIIVYPPGPINNFCRFITRYIDILPLQQNRFTRDLTSTNEEVVLAFLSLFLLCTIESIISSVLLGTDPRNPLSSVAFSVKLLIELLRDLRAPDSLSGYQKGQPLRLRPVAAAVALVTLVLGLEVVILFLSEKRTREVLNSKASLRLVYPTAPNFPGTRFNSRASLDRPCAGISMLGVQQGRTLINACVTANLTGSGFDLFRRLKPDDADVRYEIVTDVHQYGMEHSVRIGGLAAVYSGRAFLTLSDGEARLVGSLRRELEHESERVRYVHLQVIAFVCSIYKRATNDKSVDLGYLNKLPIEFESLGRGPDVHLTRVKGKAVQRRSLRYVTRTHGRLPRGSAALRVGHHVLRGAMGVLVTSDETKNLDTDLFLRDGMERAGRAVIWSESVRFLNWLSLCILLGVAFLTMMVIRVARSPRAFAEVSAAWVRREVWAEEGRSPVELTTKENKRFRVPLREEAVNVGLMKGRMVED